MQSEGNPGGDAMPAPAASPKIGRIVSISGPRVVVLLDQDPTGRTAPVQVGMLVTVCAPNSSIFGLVEGLTIPMPRTSDDDKELRVAEVSLLGEVPRAGPNANRFQRGVTQLPCLDEMVTLASQSDIRAVYALPDRQTVRIGTVHQSGGVPATISVDDLLGRHFAVLGTTGTGKSCALTLILKGVLAQNPNAHVLLLDPHGEYGRAFSDTAEHLTGDGFRLPYWIFNFEEIIEVMFGADKAEHSAEILLLRDLIVTAKTNFSPEARQTMLITVDTPIPYALGEINRLLEEMIGKLENRNALGPYLALKARLLSLKADQRYGFMFATGLNVRDNLPSLLGRIFRVPAMGKPIAILDLTGIPTEVLNVVVAVICRMAFDFALWGGQEVPLLLVCEEAHRYAPQDEGLGFEPAKRGLARIAKEGRKYGISLGVVSQRPSDLASSILSQCNTVLAFRMTNERDQEIIQASLSDAASPLVGCLPLLGNGEVLMVGEAVPVPMRLHVGALPPNERPRSGSASFSKRWQNGDMSPNLLDRIVECWRGQRMPGAALPTE